MKKKGTTLIKEIAEQLGLSPGTVSIVLNGRGDAMRISKATQERVREAAKEMNYQPNIYARRLRSAGNEEVAKVIAIFWRSDFADAIMGRFLRGMYDTVKENGYQVEFFLQLYDYEKLHEWQTIMSASRFSGIIVGGASDEDINFLNQNNFDLPIILINRNEERYHGVYVNDYEIGKMTGKLLSTHQHKKVGVITMERKGHGAYLRQAGFYEACCQYHMQMASEWVVEASERHYLAGYEAAQQLLKHKDLPTALFVMSAGQALGVVQACKDAGIKVPEEMEIITYGDSDVLEYCSPTISSVFLPIECLAENALQLMYVVLENAIEMPISRMLCAEYVFRESCGGFVEVS